MLSKETIQLCIDELENRYRENFRTINNNETWMAQRGHILYKFEHALYELKSELQIIEEENLNE